MATFESPLTPFERDFRSSHKDIKRHKDANIKWSRGVRPLAGQKQFATDEDEAAAKSTHARARPMKFSIPKEVGTVKFSRCSPPSRSRACLNNWDELHDAASAASGKPRVGTGKVSTIPAAAAAPPKGTSTDPFLYSFDNTDSPPPVMTLDVFVKPNVRATEKLVEKEYEVLDDNGDAVKGRKARQVLRKAQGNSPKSDAAATQGDGTADALLDEEEFELV